MAPPSWSPLEGIVEAYAAFLKGDEGRAAELIASVTAEAKARAERADAGGARTGSQQISPWLGGYVDKINAAVEKGGAGPAPLLVRLVGAMRAADGALLAALGEDSYDPVKRLDLWALTPRRAEAYDGIWRALPCRTVVGRAADFAAAAERLSEVAGPLVRCPVGAPGDRDFN